MAEVQPFPRGCSREEVGVTREAVEVVPPLGQCRVLTVPLPGLVLPVAAVLAAVVKRGLGRMMGEVVQPLGVVGVAWALVVLEVGGVLALVLVLVSTLLSPMEPLACLPMASQPCPLVAWSPRCLDSSSSSSSSPFWACLGASPR